MRVNCDRIVRCSTALLVFGVLSFATNLPVFSAADPKPSPLFKSSLETSIEKLDVTEATPVPSTNVKVESPALTKGGATFDGTATCTGTTTCNDEPTCANTPSCDG